MEARSKKEEEAIAEEMEKLISNWQTYGKQSKKEKNTKISKRIIRFVRGKRLHELIQKN